MPPRQSTSVRAELVEALPFSSSPRKEEDPSTGSGRTVACGTYTSASPLPPIIVIFGGHLGKRGRSTFGAAGLAIDLRARLRRLAFGQRLQDRGHALEREILVIVVVDLDHRRVG